MEKLFSNHTVGGVSTRILLILQLSIVLLLLAACGHGIRSVWPDMGISTILPKPASKEIRIDLNREDCFRADIYDSSEKDYQAYTANCQKQGFTVDCEAAAAEYTAYNQDGFRLRISYFKYSEKYSIMLDAPKANGTFVWPSIGMAALIPVPKTNMGTISLDSTREFHAYVGETTIDDYNAYIQECIEDGFTVDYSKSEKRFYAHNTAGDSLYIEYQGFHTMFISISAAEKPASQKQPHQEPFNE